MDDTQCHGLLFQMIFCFSVLWTISNGQQLYESGCDSEQDSFYRGCKEKDLETNIQRLEEQNKELLLGLRDIELRNVKYAVVYNDILKLYGSKFVPNDTNIADICFRHPDFVTGSATDCHRFYNCSEKSSFFREMTSWPTPYLHECPYPFLFSEESLQCENYTDVVCGARFEATWECRYYYHQCKAAHCKQCAFRFPKCEDKNDGLWLLPEQGFSPLYMVCQNKRTIKTGYCPINNAWQTQTYPYNGKCEHLFAIPNEYNSIGYMPSCKGVADGTFLSTSVRCDVFYYCVSGTAYFDRCLNGLVFDVARKTCVLETTTCTTVS